MREYKSVDVSERQLEDLIRQGTGLVEEGLRYVDHQKKTDRGPLDILMVDSGGALVVAELKVAEEDAMLVQGIDYYDYVVRNIEGFARAYRNFNINPNQTARLFLIAPSFSLFLINRCKWIDIPISLFTYKCITLDEGEEIIPVFSEVTIPSIPEPVKTYSLEENLEYITNQDARKMAKDLLTEIETWEKDLISIDAIKFDISLKVSGRVFSYLSPRRGFFVIGTYNEENKWSDFPVKRNEDLESIKTLLKANVNRLKQ